ncbi:MAG: hypothetical protein Kow0029_16210 [Candidatus Rifleibacteriota bacterium]
MIKKLMLVTAVILAFTGSAIFGADLFQLVPQEADFVIQVNINKILTTPEAKKALMESLEKSPEQKAAFDDFVKNTGFNPMENLNQVVVFSTGKIDPKNPSQIAGAIFEGKFEINKILEAIKKDEKAAKDVEIKKVDGFDAVFPKNKKDGYGLFLDANTAVVGAEPGVMAVKDIKLGKAKNVTARKEFFDILKKIDKNATVSGAGLIPQDLKEKVKANPQAAPLASLNYFHFAFSHGQNIEFTFNGEVDKKENVETVMTSLNGFLAMLKMFAAQAPEAAEVLNMVKLTAKGTTVAINLNVPRAKLEEIKKRMEQKINEMKQKGAMEEKEENKDRK